MTPEQEQEALFLLMGENYRKYYRDEKFWRELHSIDKEMHPGSIRMEPFKKFLVKSTNPAYFGDNQRTLVVQFETEEMRDKMLHLLTKFFNTTSVVFVPETREEEGKVIYQLRSNMEKPQWAKLAMFCKYRFDREIRMREGRSPEEREALRQECQEKVDECLGGSGRWRATVGMPAWCTLMGTPEVLRDKNVGKVDVRHKTEEMRDVERGVPLIFKDILFHVGVDKQKAQHSPLDDSPYHVGYHVDDQAKLESVENGEILSLLHEAFGSNFFAKELPFANRFLRGTVASVSLQALREGRLEPIIIAGGGGIGLVLALIGKRWELLGRLDSLAMDEQAFENAWKRLEAADHAPPLSAEDKSREAVLKEAFSPENERRIEELLRSAEAKAAIGVAEISPSQNVLEAHAKGALGALQTGL